MTAYVVAVLQRTSFGVAGVQAATRFDAGASVVSLFVVVQLIVYSSMQLPAGVLVDRFGPRVTISAGAALMFLGQLNLAFAESIPVAIVARVLVGMGDALTFTSVLRLLPVWFAESRVPVLSQLTSLLGQLGQVLSAIPFALLLHTVGWTTSFLASASLSALASLLVVVAVRSAPPGTPFRTARSEARVTRQIWDVVRVPGTQLGFWVHWTTGFPSIVFALMWGYPYLQQGQGLSGAAASALFVVYVLAGAVAGPVTGVLTQRHPLRRTTMALAIIAVQAIPWAVVLLLPGRAPLWLLVVLVICLGAGPPGSMIAFDLARTSNPRDRYGTASGVVIMGTFTAGMLTIFVIGVVLDLLGGYSPEAFRVAMSTQFVFLAIGLALLLEARSRARAYGHRVHGEVVPPWPVAIRREWRRRYGDDRVPRWLRGAEGRASGPEPTEPERPDDEPPQPTP